MRRRFLLHKYIFFEMLPTFLLGVLVFVLVLLTFQALRLTEFVLVHGVNVATIIKMVLYLSVSFLPVIIPMSLLFALLLTYGRLSNDSEVIAFKSLGYSFFSISFPAFVLATLASILSAQTSFHLAPWGNRQFEILIGQLHSVKASTTIKPGVFADGFFDMVVYANEVDNDTGKLKDIFIYDERNPQNPMTIIAKEGELIQDPLLPGHRSSLQLFNGNIHKSSEKNYTKIDFNTYKVQLEDPLEKTFKEKSMLSYQIQEIKQKLTDPSLSPDHRFLFVSEFHRRWALALTPIVFCIIGVGLGIVTNKRSEKSNGVVVCIGLIVLYWILYVAFEGLTKNKTLAPQLALWTPNLIFLLLSIYPVKKALN